MMTARNQSPGSRAPIGLIGPKASAVLAPGMHGRVLAVFRRSFYVEDKAGDLACIGLADIGAGPLNALLDDGAVIAAVAADQPVSVAEDTVLFGDAPLIALGSAVEWRPRSWAGQPALDALRTGLRAAAETASHLAPDEGFAVVVARICDEGPAEDRLPRNALGRHAAPGVAALDGWLDFRFWSREDDAPAPTEIASLIGLGPGLTPSGDDFLGGALIALAALGEDPVRLALAARVREFVAERTGIVSRAHLACAADGLGAEALHAALAAIVTGDVKAIPKHLAAIDRIGHSSGWDALAGALIVLRRQARRPS